ncbi:MAG: hypothetical protein K2M79_07355 [Muribaculaceae bacterium]|nr:hypothetical protein [Muribaculaceae bacterium]
MALSRKMPRLMNCIVKTSDITDHNINVAIDAEEIITELALPFLSLNTNSEDVEFIILDDIIIHGTSLRIVYQNICEMFSSKAHVSCIFRHERANISDFVNTEDLSIIKSIDQKTVDAYTDAIAETVKQCQLPIDMEFPVFKLNSSIEEIKNAIDENSNLPLYYSSDRCLSYNLASFPTVSNNVDFCKARFFGKNDFTLLEIFSPIIISESDILSTDKSLFGNTLYSAIWEKLTRNLRIELNPDYKKSPVQMIAQLRESFIRSLVVIANYIFSLSAFAINADSILPFNLKKHIELSKSDLSLLIGRKLTDEVYGAMMAAVEMGETYSSPREKYMHIPSSFAPKAFKSEIDGERFLTAFLADTPSEAFDSIFKFQHYTNPKFENPYIAYERLFFGETHESLAETTSIFFDIEECTRELYYWIDENIDAGYIVPKFETVKSDDDGIFWRRFFHAGIRKKDNSGCS